jgi:hypothetical protein
MTSEYRVLATPCPYESVNPLEPRWYTVWSAIVGAAMPWGRCEAIEPVRARADALASAAQDNPPYMPKVVLDVVVPLDVATRAAWENRIPDTVALAILLHEAQS